MVSKYFKNLKIIKFKNYGSGTTLIELVVIVFIVAIFSTILIANFPEIERQFALSRASYKLAQDFRRIQDLGFSGVQVSNSAGHPITTIRGYGIYVNRNLSATQYILYADVASDEGDPGNKKYDGSPSLECSQEPTSAPTSDCIVETVNVSQENSSVYIEGLEGISGNYTSINFNPPNPVISIENKSDSNSSRVGIILGLVSGDSQRIIWINTSGLINVQ